MSKLQSRKLSNGITILCETTDNDMSYFAVGFNVGSRDEGVFGPHGIAHCVEHMLFKSTTNRTTQELALEMDKVGALTNAFTSIEQTVYHVDFNGKDFDTVTDVFFDSILHPLFKQEEFDTEKEVIRQEILMYLSDPNDRASEWLISETFKNSGYGHNVIGTWNSVSKLKSEDLKRFYEKHYTPDRCVICYTGKLGIRALENKLKKYTDELGERARNTKYIEPKLTFVKQNNSTFIKGLEQNSIYILGNETCFATSDYRRTYAVSQCLNAILASGMSSRLWKRIREELGLVYGIHAFCDNVGIIDLNGIKCKSDKDSEMVVKEIMKVVNDLIQNGVTKEELETACNSIEMNILSCEQNLNRAASDYATEFTSRGVNVKVEREKLIKIIRSVTPKEVVALAKKIYTDPVVLVARPGNIVPRTKFIMKEWMKKATFIANKLMEKVNDKLGRK